MNSHAKQEIEEFTSRIQPFFDAMLDDVKFVGQIPRTPANAGVWDRANIRTFFAILEALSNLMREQALLLHRHGWKGLCAQIIPKLRPDCRLTLREGVKISISAMASLRNPKIQPIDFGKDPGWQDFLAAESVRDRLMHPKTAQHLTVSAEECACQNRAVVWYFRLVVDSMGLERPEYLMDSPIYP